jgi:hypothetical protein
MKRLLLVLVVLATLAGVAGSATASTAAVVIRFEKHAIAPGHYVGTACDGGTIDMQLSNSSVTGNVQQFTATVQLACAGRGTLTAVLAGSFNFSTGRTVLNGAVVAGWLVGAQVHEEGQLVGLDPFTFIGTVQLMPGSAD